MPVKSKLLMVYDYNIPPHTSRITHSSPYQLEQALKEFFDVFRLGEITAPEADIVFNTMPMVTKGGTGSDLFTMGHKTAFWGTSPLEGIGYQYFQYCDIVFNSIPSWKHKLPKGKIVTLLDAIDPTYKYYPEEPLIYDVGFLGSEIEATRVNLLNKIDKEFKLLRGQMSLGEESARALSRCKLVLSVQDWDSHNADIEKRLFTFGNIRPILIRMSPDYLSIGKPGEHYIAYGSDEECLKKIDYYLKHMDEAEIIGNNLKKVLKHHTFRDRAKTVYKTYMEGIK